MGSESEETTGAEEAGSGGTAAPSQTRFLVVSTAVVIVLIALTAWAGSAKTERAKLDSLQMGTAALAASMKYPLLEAASLRTAAGRERLQPMVEEIAKAGGYVYVVLTDEKGKVLATTDLNLQGKNLIDVLKASEGPRVERTFNELRATAPVMVGGSPIGYLRVDVVR
ncbi:MAG: hypothetical protein IIC73_01450 [Armatimonadetes bacterium]|nr:hypothetical protein [Armatimonadota bacterium]